MKLSKRLELVASFVPRGSRVADVGTDHGYIPIHLVEEGICREALALDVREGPLARAAAHIREKGLEDRIGLRKSDGLKALVPGEADTAVIAGMGGQLVIHILEEGRHMWDSICTWILSPQSELDKVRHYLEEEGFAICREAMVFDEGKYYTVMEVKRGKMHYEKPSEYLYGRELIQRQDPVLLDYLQQEKRRILGILEGLNGQEGMGAESAANELTRQLETIKEAVYAMQ